MHFMLTSFNFDAKKKKNFFLNLLFQFHYKVHLDKMIGACYQSVDTFTTTITQIFYDIMHTYINKMTHNQMPTSKCINIGLWCGWQTIYEWILINISWFFFRKNSIYVVFAIYQKLVTYCMFWPVFVLCMDWLEVCFYFFFLFR